MKEVAIFTIGFLAGACLVVRIYNDSIEKKRRTPMVYNHHVVTPTYRHHCTDSSICNVRYGNVDSTSNSYTKQTLK